MGVGGYLFCLSLSLLGHLSIRSLCPWCHLAWLEPGTGGYTALESACFPSDCTTATVVPGFSSSTLIPA